MGTENRLPTVIIKEMGLTHEEFYDKLPLLLAGIPYQHANDTIRFQLNRKNLEIILAPEASRQLSSSMRLPVTTISFRFFDCSAEEIEEFINHFNLTFMKGGG